MSECYSCEEPNQLALVSDLVRLQCLKVIPSAWFFNSVGYSANLISNVFGMRL